MERQRQSIPIQGINRAESDDTVKDGSCEDIYNFRYRAGVFENVRQPLLLYPIEQSGGFSVVHRLDVMEPGEYLAEKDGGLYRVKIADGTVTEQEKITILPADAADVRYFHFGNVLYLNYTQGGELQELCFHYKDNAFARVDLNGIEPVRLSISSQYKSADKELIGDEDEIPQLKSVKVARVERYSDDPNQNKEEFFYNVGLKRLTDEGYINGTSLTFGAYKLFDGSVVSPSALRIITSDEDDKTSEYLYKVPDIDTEHYSCYGRVAGVKPTIKVEIPNTAMNNPLIEKIVLYSTRNTPTYNFERVHLDFGTNGFDVEKIDLGLSIAPFGHRVAFRCSHGCIWNKYLDESTGPFYEIGEIKFREGKTTLELNYDDHYKNIEHQPVFTPNYSIHSTISEGKYECNDRLHRFNLRTTLFGGGSPFASADDNISGCTYHASSSIECGADYTLKVNGETQVVQTRVPGHYWKLNGSGRLYYIRNIQSYPDSRAEKVNIWVKETGKTIVSKEIQLTSDTGTNHSFAIAKQSADLMGFKVYNNHLEAFQPLTTNAGYIPEDRPRKMIVEKNKIQVSHPSNPFVYAPANIYTVGGQGEQIREIISTAERMTEVAYGYQPLLVFTNRTTYALESGEGEVLYARNIPILSQAMIEGTNAIEGNGAVFFVSTSGVTAIVRGQVSTISEPMKRWAGLIASDATIPDFEEYTRAARLMFNRKESELIVYNAAYSHAYIYSLLGKYWTRRSWDAVIEPYFGEIVTAGGVASLSEEDPARPVASCKLVTRPLKLGSLEYKRLETLAARMRWGQDSGFSLSIDGSDDAMQWVPLRTESNQPSIRRTPSSFRYHRVQLTGSVTDYLAITHFDVEFYNKFVHKLR